MGCDLQRGRKSMKASIILVTWSPSKDRLNLLKKTIASLKESTEVPYEFIVVDNGPKEQTDFLKTQKIDKHIINVMNKGIGYGRNQGFKEAIGDYIAYIDSDLLFEKDWLKEGIELLEKYPEKKLIASTCFSSHQTVKSFFHGSCGENFLWSRACPAGLVFRKESFYDLGLWAIHPRSGTFLCKVAKIKKYLFISLVFPKVVHRGVYSSYNHKSLIKNRTWKNLWGLEKG